MSNRPLACAAALCFALVPLSAVAQSEALLAEVRVHARGASNRAAAELSACEAQHCPRLPHLSLLNAVLRLSDGRATDAVAQLRKVPPPEGLAPFHSWYLGEAEFYAGERGLGLTSLEFAAATAPAGSALAQKARARLAEVLGQEGNHARALPLLDALLKGRAAPELLLHRARALRAAGKEKAACADLRKVAVGWPTHPACEEALRMLGRENLAAADHLKRARVLLEAREPKWAVEALDLARPARGREQPEGLLLRARALFQLSRREEGEAALEEATRSDRKLLPAATWLRARRLMRAGDNAGALRLAQGLVRSYPKAEESEDARYFAGWLKMQLGQHAEAAEAFGAYVEAHPRTRRADEAAWLRAFALIRAQALPGAIEALESFPSKWPRSSLTPTARYWAARARQLSGEKGADVLGAYRGVREAHPGTFYAALATTRLAELGVSPGALFPALPVELPGEPLAHLRLSSLLSSVGLFADAAAELKQGLGRVSAAEALSCGHALRQMGEFGSAYALAVRHLWSSAYGKKDPHALALLYPRAFRDAVESAAGSHGVDPHLVWAIMRRESAFKPDVVSAADARGLMQIIPPTATRIAAELQRALDSADALYAPGMNIDFGAWYLAALSRRFGHPALVAAAYNAGPSATLEWLSERGELELDLFVETIPFKETRGYVKQVVADLLLYRQFYSDKPSPLAFKLPKPRPEGVAF